MWRYSLPDLFYFVTLHLTCRIRRFIFLAAHGKIAGAQLL
jgi:hypothetical protein